MLSAVSVLHSRVDPSTSVSKNVTVPTGNENAASGLLTPLGPQRIGPCNGAKTAAASDRQNKVASGVILS